MPGQLLGLRLHLHLWGAFHTHLHVHMATSPAAATSVSRSYPLAADWEPDPELQPLPFFPFYGLEICLLHERGSKRAPLLGQHLHLLHRVL